MTAKGGSSGAGKKHGERIKTEKVFRAQTNSLFERRRQDRFLVTHQYFALVLKVSRKGEEDLVIEGWATDLSASGAGACVDRFLPRDTIVGIELVGAVSPGVLQARVAWCNKLPTTGRVLKKKHYDWRMGLEFLFKNDDEKALIGDIVNKM